ncbi:VasL domain-containing protein [Serratia marcescens]|uniref:VasL domain-containing protein n=1 Tax=Serratia marcescens TaxID=615 RepID=UPI0002B86FA7|nr:VasL domain-containing protein [Serratia marcescens]EMF07035.1 hypothetical protein F518_04203 [Serratia marcescens VGH107]
MSTILTTTGTKALKINCHDPRSHQSFLQFSDDMHHWQTRINDSIWWLEREKQCLALFQQYGYDLQNGVWYCLIACQRSGWKGIASASILLANGFTKQHPPCWPPLAALELRRQVLDSYYRRLLPLIYALPMETVSTSELSQLLTAHDVLHKQATALHFPQQNVIRQLSAWLKTHIHTVEQHSMTPTVSAIPLLTPVAAAPSLAPKPVVRKLLWSSVGAVVALSGMLLMQLSDNPEVLRFSNRIWPGNPLVKQWQQRQEKTSAILPTNISTQQLSQLLDTLEQRLLDAEQKRKPYMTISELKTSVYQMRDTLRQQASMMENQLNQLQIQQENSKPISAATLYTLSLQIEALKSRLSLLSDIVLVQEEPERPIGKKQK